MNEVTFLFKHYPLTDTIFNELTVFLAKIFLFFF